MTPGGFTGSELVGELAPALKLSAAAGDATAQIRKYAVIDLEPLKR